MDKDNKFHGSKSENGSPPINSSTEKETLNDQGSSNADTSKTDFNEKPGCSRDLSPKPGTSKSAFDPKPGSSRELSPKPGTSVLEIEQNNIIDIAQSMLKDEHGIPVVPKIDCPHLKSVRREIKTININAGCSMCDSTGENWVCLICEDVFCSRYVNGHMVKHNEETGHPIALSFSDISVWCYACDDYIDGEVLYTVRNLVHEAKFGYDLQFYYNAINA